MASHFDAHSHPFQAPVGSMLGRLRGTGAPGLQVDRSIHLPGRAGTVGRANGNHRGQVHGRRGIEMLLSIPPKQSGTTYRRHTMNWTRAEVLAALHLYLQLPFGQLHRGQPRIVQLARWLGRTPSSVAMKLVNIASLDPAITGSGRVGLQKASKLDRDVWAEVTASWSNVLGGAAAAYEHFAAQEGLTAIEADHIEPAELAAVSGDLDLPFDTERETAVKVRLNQVRFRRWVLASYGGRCCVTGLQEPKLLIASHIVPWAENAVHRLNPRNGLCLSPLYDRAFDQGLITITPVSLQIRVGRRLREAVADTYAQQAFVALDGIPIRASDRLRPDDELLAWHQRRFS